MQWLKLAPATPNVSHDLRSHCLVVASQLASVPPARLPLGFFADCFMDGTFAGAFCVAFLPYLVALIFSAGSSQSFELVVRLPLELDGVATFFIPIFDE